jgi:hypothetical protein
MRAYARAPFGSAGPCMREDGIDWRRTVGKACLFCMNFTLFRWPVVSKRPKPRTVSEECSPYTAGTARDTLVCATRCGGGAGSCSWFVAAHALDEMKIAPGRSCLPTHTAKYSLGGGAASKRALSVRISHTHTTSSGYPFDTSDTQRHCPHQVAWVRASLTNR